MPEIAMPLSETWPPPDAAETAPETVPPLVPELSQLMIHLLKGVLYRDDDERLWASLLRLQARVREQAAVLLLELVLDEAKQPTFAFAVEPPEEVPADLAERESLGPCPKCGAPVVEHGTSYVCTKSLGPDKTCDFRSGRTILQQPIEPEQMKKLLSEGKTDLLTGFVSARTRRKFSAYLVRQPDGKIGFEFAPREASEKKGRSATRKKAKAAETS